MLCLFLVYLSIFSAANTERLPVSCGQIRQIVDSHNFKRTMAARGLIPRQPAASNMKFMVWDEELAEKAARWAENGQFIHNQDRTVPSQRWNLVGENLYISKFYSTIDVKVIPKFEDALNAWFEEHWKYGFEPYTLEAAKRIGHYTQMIWANSTRVGCGISQTKKGRMTTTLYVCNYGPTGNWIGQTPYQPSPFRNCVRCNRGDCENLYGIYCSYKI
ncbi:unnamed protein product [Chilo suppressalis]|uniref:SCP domain-containing protein n=1 Tax=Chilo suppressalis TaxID=168631 RepID=A0ABN8BI32_CHISP|nr:unnamed protein product [Chilo suppressalis]